MTIDDLELKRCFDGGSAAFRQSLSCEENPWSPGTGRWAAWDAGWRSAQQFTSGQTVGGSYGSSSV